MTVIGDLLCDLPAKSQLARPSSAQLQRSTYRPWSQGRPGTRMQRFALDAVHCNAKTRTRLLAGLPLTPVLYSPQAVKVLPPRYVRAVLQVGAVRTLIQAMFDREIAYLRGVVAGRYVVANCSTPAELGERAAATARRMMHDIIGD